MPRGPRSRRLPVRTVRAPRALLPRRAGRCLAPGKLGRLPSGLGLPVVRQGPAGAARGSGWFCSESKPGNPTSLGDAPLPPPGRFVGKGLIGSPPSSPAVEPGIARVRGHRGPEAVTGPSARARSCCAQSLLARAQPARACPPGHNKVGREPRAVVRPARRAPDARPEPARPGDHSRTDSQAGVGWRGAMEAPLLSLAFCLLCAGEVLFLR